MNEKLIQFKGVTKKFGHNRVLNSINFSIPEGKIIGIIGASGEGKSTILKMIASFYKPSKGKIFYSDKDILKSSKQIKKLFGFAIEDGSFYENLTVRENLLYFGRLYGVKRKILLPRVKGLMIFVGLDNASNVLAKNLSLGMKKRLDLACSLIHKPKILILDEPTADLDPLLRRQMIKLIKKINSHKTTVIFTTQLLDEADNICDKIAILYNEKIVEEGNPSKIKKKYNAKDLDSVFNKIFSKKGRKTYRESVKEKSKVEFKDEKKSDEVFEKVLSSEDSVPSKKELEEFYGRKKKK